MKRISFLKITLAIFAFLIACNLTVSAQKVDCSKTTDEEIVAAIQTNLSAKYSSQMNHINIHVKNGEVIIQGWTPNKKDRKEIEKIVKKTKCVKKVTNNLKIGTDGGCTNGTKPCGEICIPNDQTCNIKGKG